MSDALPPPDQPSLDSLRRELEREFEFKRREAKAKEKRMRDKLEEDRRDWEAHRREQAKVLADQKEALRRQSESLQKLERRKTHQEIELKSKHEALDGDRAAEQQRWEKAAKRTAVLEAKVAQWEGQRGLLGMLFALVGLALLALSLSGRPQATTWMRGIAAASVIVGALLYLQSRWATRQMRRGKDSV